MKNKLPKAFKKRWIAALLSGKYKQGKESLKSGDKYCCLGVACEVAGARIVKNACFIWSHKNVKGISKVPKILKGDRDIPETLANMNDKGKRFSTIAKWIDKNL